MAIEGTIQTLLGNLVSGRCYPLVAPDKPTFPYITFQVVSNIPNVTLNGRNATENRRLQIDIWDRSYGGSKTLEGSVKTAMDSAAFVNVPVLYSETYEVDTKVYRVSMDYSIWS